MFKIPFDFKKVTMHIVVIPLTKKLANTYHPNKNQCGSIDRSSPKTYIDSDNKENQNIADMLKFFCRNYHL
jgi:hypothetical protein